jgi:hypothetical protein
MIKEYTFHSPMPEKLGRVDNADFHRIASVSQKIGSKYADQSIPSYILSPASTGYQITSEGEVSVITGRVYKELFSVDNVTRPLTSEENRQILETVEPFIQAAEDWLHPNETVVAEFFREPQHAAYAGPWHTDGVPDTDNFRGVIFYDSLPTDFAVGTMKFDLHEGQYPPTSEEVDSLVTGPTLYENLQSNDSGIKLVKGPDPLNAVGIANANLHRVTEVPQSADGTVRTFLRLATTKNLT